jgi:hypothetical protein
MVDQEVVDILAEIKHRITAAEKPTPAQNGAGLQETLVNHNSSDNSASYSSMVVLARAWDRLPPVVSNRTGVTASVELWLKRTLRRALRWITWEQVNFNAATHQTLLELIESLNSANKRLVALERRVESLNEELQKELRNTNQNLSSEMTTQRDQLERHRAEIARYQAEVNSQHALMKSDFEVAHSLREAQTTDFNARLDALTAAREQSSSEFQSRLAELVKEFRERDERLLDEQRVCFKQLSLELTESRVLQDRTRRELDARVATLEDSAKN